MQFRLYPLRFRLLAVDSVRFPDSGAANCLRGALGLALYRQSVDSEAVRTDFSTPSSHSAYVRLFEPSARPGPSGLARPPRPFVLRTSASDLHCVPHGSVWSFDLNLFDLRPPNLVAPLRTAVEMVAGEGIGVGRGRSRLLDMLLLDDRGEPRLSLLNCEQPPPPLSIPLDPVAVPIRRVRVRFVTPAELKAAGRPDAPPEFATLFARLRDRISTLCALYGDGPLAIDFRAMAVRARQVRLVRADLIHVSRSRRSSRTGQTHPLGGLTGEVEYEGDLAGFLPFLLAGRWTGVGRQTVWGKGAIETEVLDPAM